MFDEVLDTCISAVVEGLEDFFNIVTYPSRKYIKSAIFIACGFFGFSIVGYLLQWFLFVNWYEALTAIIILAIIYFVSDLSLNQVQDVANNMVVKTTQVFNDTKQSFSSSGKKKKSAKSTKANSKPKSKR